MTEEIQQEDISGEEMLKQSMAQFEAEEELPEVEPEQQEKPEPEHELSEIAKKDGYQTKEQWVASGKDADDYLTEEEFTRVGEIRDDKGVSRQKLAKTNVQLQATIDEVLRNQREALAAAEQRGRQMEIDALKAKQKEAVDYGNTEDALNLEREILAKQAPPPQQPQQPQFDPEIKEWYDNNSHWYETDQAAAGLVNSTLKQNEGMPFADAIKIAESKARQYFPYHFDGAGDAQPSKKPLVRPRAPTETTRKPVGSSKKKTFNDLPVEMRPYAKKAAKAAGMSESDYVEQML